MLKQLSQAIGLYVLGPVLAGVAIYFAQRVGKFLSDRRHSKLFIKAVDRDKHIHQALYELLYSLNAIRAYVAMIHNGSYFVDGSEDLKKTRTHEVVRDGISYEAQNYQDVRLSLMKDETELIRNEGPVYRARSDIKDGRFARMLDSQRAKAIARCPIRRDSQIIGFIGVDFDHDQPCGDLSLMTVIAGRIELVLYDFKK